MNVRDLLDQTRKGKLLPAYVVVGDQQLLVARVVDAVRAATVGSGPRGLSEDFFEAASVRAASVVAACRSLPMLSRWRLVTVRGPEAWKVDDTDLVLAYLDAPSPSTVLLVIAGEKLDGKTKFAQQAKKRGLIVECQAPREAELAGWIEEEARVRGAVLEAGVATSLALLVGADLDALADAIERLRLFAAGRAIAEADLDDVVAPLREASQFDLPDSMLDRDVPRTIQMLDNLARQRKPGLLLLAFVATRVRQIARARDAMDKGQDPMAALQGHVPPYSAGKVAGQARNWTAPQVVRALRALAHADQRLKSGGGRDRDQRVLEELALALAQR